MRLNIGLGATLLLSGGGSSLVAFNSVLTSAFMPTETHQRPHANRRAAWCHVPHSPPLHVSTAERTTRRLAADGSDEATSEDGDDELLDFSTGDLARLDTSRMYADLVNRAQQIESSGG